MEPTHAHPATPSLPLGIKLSSALLVRLQAISGLIFAVFASLHLVNTVLGAFSPEAYNAYQRALRPLYQHPAVEVSLILVPLIVHATVSVLRMRRRRQSREAPAHGSLRLHRYGGWFLLAAMAGHITATRGPALWKDAFPEFEGVAFTFQYMPLFFYPYYFALALAGIVHLTIGVPTALRRLGLRVPRAVTSGAGPRAALLAVCVAVTLGVAGLGGLLFPVGDLSAHPFARVVQATYAALLGGL